jgi:hypothetical protein
MISQFWSKVHKESNHWKTINLLEEFMFINKPKIIINDPLNSKRKANWEKLMTCWITKERLG